MEKCDILIIGAGVVGLSIAERLSKKSNLETILVEQHDGFGRETSSRNSEVVHAGFYYATGSLKAILCLKGNRMLYELFQRNGIPYNRCGKIVVGITEQEISKVHGLYRQGLDNGVEGLTLIDGKRIQELEPAVCGKIGLLSPSTGIFDTHHYMAWLAQQSLENGVAIAYRCRVQGIVATLPGYQIDIIDADGVPMQLRAEVVINAAGLGADQVAAMVGIDPDQAGYRQYPCKGEYFSVSPRHRGRLSRLVYPAPTLLSLGIHAVIGMDGSLRLGPNAFYVDTIDYAVDPTHGDEFFESAQKYFPFISSDDLAPDMAGIRPKLQPPGSNGFYDFQIREESKRGLAGFFNLIGIESPGLTSSPAIAEYVEGLLLGSGSGP